MLLWHRIIKFAAMRNRWLFLIIFTLLLLAAVQPVAGQCAMCKAVAETGQQNEPGLADGLNGGILYLMAFPYLLLAAVGYAIYRHRKLNES